MRPFYFMSFRRRSKGDLTWYEVHIFGKLQAKFVLSLEKYPVIVVEGSKHGLQNRGMRRKQVRMMQGCLKHIFVKTFVETGRNKDDNRFFFFLLCNFNRIKKLITWHSLKLFINSSRHGKNHGFGFIQKRCKTKRVCNECITTGQTNAGKINFYLKN